MTLSFPPAQVLKGSDRLTLIEILKYQVFTHGKLVLCQILC